MNANDAEYYRELLAANVDAFYASKFQNGEVIADWDYAAWVLGRTAGIIPFGTRNCNTMLSH